MKAIILSVTVLLLTGCVNPYKAPILRLAKPNGLVEQYKVYVENDKTLNPVIKQAKLNRADAFISYTEGLND